MLNSFLTLILHFITSSFASSSGTAPSSANWLRSTPAWLSLSPYHRHLPSVPPLHTTSPETPRLAQPQATDHPSRDRDRSIGSGISLFSTAKHSNISHLQKRIDLVQHEPSSMHAFIDSVNECRTLIGSSSSSATSELRRTRSFVTLTGQSGHATIVRPDRSLRYLLSHLKRLHATETTHMPPIVVHPTLFEILSGTRSQPFTLDNSIFTGSEPWIPGSASRNPNRASAQENPTVTEDTAAFVGPESTPQADPAANNAVNVGATSVVRSRNPPLVSAGIYRRIARTSSSSSGAFLPRNRSLGPPGMGIYPQYLTLQAILLGGGRPFTSATLDHLLLVGTLGFRATLTNLISRSLRHPGNPAPNDTSATTFCFTPHTIRFLSFFAARPAAARASVPAAGSTWMDLLPGIPVQGIRSAD